LILAFHIRRVLSWFLGTTRQKPQPNRAYIFHFLS